MNTVWKCKSCEYGPCYYYTEKKEPENSIYQNEDTPPGYCPQFGECGTADFNVVLPEITLNTKTTESMQEWLSGEGYDNTPEQIRDGILGFGFSPILFRYEDALAVLQLLREYEDNNHYLSSWQRDDWLKRFKKISKYDLINAIFPEAFKAGIIFGEMIRQKGEHK